MDCDIEFYQWKHSLVYTPVLAIPYFDANFVVESNTSDVAVGAVLMQYDQLVVFM